MNILQKFLAVLAVLPFVSLHVACQTTSANLQNNQPSASKSGNKTGANNNSADGVLPKIVYYKTAPRYEIKPQDLPAPFATASARRRSKLVPQSASSTLNLPKGFKINVYAEGGFKNPRMMRRAPNDDVFVSDAQANSIFILRDRDKDGVAEERFTFAENLAQPFGMAFNADYFYVANTDAVVRFKYKSGQTKAEGAPEKIIELTEGGYNQHWTRNIIFSPDGKKLYVSIGSSGNVEPEKDERRAAVSEYNPDGTGYRLYASGLRNPIGLAFNPVSGQLWTAVNERDGIGDNLVPDYVTSVKDGAFYGYPFAYIGQNEEPRRKGENPEAVKKSIVPDVLVTSHSAALGMTFYDGNMFPAEYKNDAFVAFHGSWNREKLTGYKIVRVRMKNGKAVGGYEDFVSGWLPDENSNEVWGRPVSVLVNADGSLLICDDGADKIWRVSYEKQGN